MKKPEEENHRFFHVYHFVYSTATHRIVYQGCDGHKDV